MRPITLITCLLLPACALCQDYKNKHGKGRITETAALRAELGWNRAWLASLGVSYIKSNVNRRAPFSLVGYAAAEASQANYLIPSRYYGLKGGMEMSVFFVACGAELRNITDFAGRNQVIFTPKAGLSFYGYGSLFFGYNLFDKEDNVFSMIHNQLSLSINLNRKLFKGLIFPGR